MEKEHFKQSQNVRVEEPNDDDVENPPYSPSSVLLKWDRFDQRGRNALSDLLLSGDLADVTLACTGEYIKAHKVVLASSSGYFRQAFRENSCKHPIVLMKGIEFKELNCMLNLIYFGEARVHQHEINKFIEAANFLEIDGVNFPTDEPHLFQHPPNYSPRVNERQPNEAAMNASNTGKNMYDASYKSRNEEHNTSGSGVYPNPLATEGIYNRSEKNGNENQSLSDFMHQMTQRYQISESNLDSLATHALPQGESNSINHCYPEKTVGDFNPPWPPNAYYPYSMNYDAREKYNMDPRTATTVSNHSQMPPPCPRSPLNYRRPHDSLSSQCKESSTAQSFKNYRAPQTNILSPPGRFSQYRQNYTPVQCIPRAAVQKNRNTSANFSPTEKECFQTRNSTTPPPIFMNTSGRYHPYSKCRKVSSATATMTPNSETYNLYTPTPTATITDRTSSVQTTQTDVRSHSLNPQYLSAGATSTSTGLTSSGVLNTGTKHPDKFHYQKDETSSGDSHVSIASMYTPVEVDEMANYAKVLPGNVVSCVFCKKIVKLDSLKHHIYRHHLKCKM